MDIVMDGRKIELDGDTITYGEWSVTGIRQTRDSVEAAIDAARASLGDELERFAANTLEYLQREKHLVVDDLDVPDVGVEMKGRHVLVAVRGPDYREDLAALRQTGYLHEVRPVLIAVDGAADALLAIGRRPDVIIGDMDSVSERALRSGAVLVVHGYPDGRAPGAARLAELGLDHLVWSATGTSEDIAMLLAYERGASLIVAVGTHSSMSEFLDKGRAGMASTFLVRLKVGPVLVDAKGVSRIYQSRVRKLDLVMLIGAALFALLVVTAVSQPARLFLSNLKNTLERAVDRRDHGFGSDRPRHRQPARRPADEPREAHQGCRSGERHPSVRERRPAGERRAAHRAGKSTPARRRADRCARRGHRHARQ
jgi:uncharacterized membrane-anchored protein